MSTIRPCCMEWANRCDVLADEVTHLNAWVEELLPHAPAHLRREWDEEQTMAAEVFG